MLNAIINVVYDIKKGTIEVGAHDLVNKMDDKLIVIDAQNKVMEWRIAFVPTIWTALIYMNNIINDDSRLKLYIIKDVMDDARHE